MNKTIKQQYDEMKSKHPDAILLMRCGDFYETYYDDAATIAEVLGITLTTRKDGTRMAGFPAHSLDTYLPVLVRKGKRVAICDQLEERMPLIKRPKPQMVELPSITAEQYALLCECIRYRIADNTRERMDAEERGLGLAYYDKMEMRLKQLKNIFPPID